MKVESLAKDAIDAIDAIRNFKLNLITLDLMMHGAEGGTIAERIKNDPELKDIPIIFILGFIAEDDAQKLINRGKDAYKPKPFMVGELISKIEKFLT